MIDENEGVLVKLTRMEGKLDLSNMRHDQHDSRFRAIENRFNSHGDRIAGLECREIGRDGERKGLLAGGKLLWATIGLIPGGAVVAVLMRAFQ